MENDNFEKTKYWVELVKWFIVSVALVSISMIIDWKFTSRDKSFDEVKFYSEKYMTDLIVLNNNIGPRYKLAQFFKSVTVDEDQRDGWERYYKEVKKEYDDLRAKDSLNREESQILEKDSLKWGEKERKRYQLLQSKIEKANIELNSELQLPDQKKSSYYIIIGGYNTLKKAEDEKNKFVNFDSKIIYRNGSYRTVIEFNDLESANKNLATIKTKKSDAYLVNASKWCSNLVPKENYFICN